MFIILIKDQYETEGEDQDTLSDYDAAIRLNEAEVGEAARKLIADVERVEFSSPDLVWIGKAGEDDAIGELKEANGLECEYSAELTEEQIDEINAQTVEAGDWVLISLQPFDSEETLTVTMKNGDQWTVKVTDAQNGSGTTVTGKLIRYQDEYPDGQYIIFTQSGSNFYALTNYGGKVQVNYDPAMGYVTYNGTGSIVWESEYIAHSGWINRYRLNAVDNSQYYLDPGAGDYNNLLQHWYGRVLMERRSADNSAAFTVKGEEGGSKYLGWSNSSFAAVDYPTNSIYLARVEDVSTRYSFTVRVDADSHGYVSGTNDAGTATGNVSEFTVTTGPVYKNEKGEILGPYDASARPITAIPKEGFHFDHWETDGGNWYSDNPVLNEPLSIGGDGDTFTAVFKKDTTVTDEMTKEQIREQLAAWASDMLSDSVTTNKTAQVSDYNNRIYEITMSASSGIRRVMPTVDLTFITDVSRSMYFPATLEEVATFTQGTKNETSPGEHKTATGEKVYADSSLYDWLNKYGDKDTVYYTVADNAAATVMAIYYDTHYYNPADTERTGIWRYYDSSNVNPPDAQNHYGVPVSSTGKNEPWGNFLTGKLYTQVGSLNRMDYLKMAAEAASGVVFDVDPNARVGLVTFAASANAGQFYGNNSAFTSALEAVDLLGGTNQGDGLDKGRDLFEENERTDPIPKRVAILITDGAPNQTGVDWGTIGDSATELKNLYGEDSIELYTLGLSMSMVGENNQNQLKAIATGGLDGGHWAMAEKGSDIVEALKTIVGSIVNEASLKGGFTDEIDEAFYPVAEDGTPLKEGDCIDLDGRKINANSLPEDGKYGRITFDGTSYGVQWSDQVVGYSANGVPTWEGKIFVKAKEDFLGGNSISTNVGTADRFVPTKYIVDGEEYPLRTGEEDDFSRTFVTPYVNVDELSMTQNSTEWTVYLGTEVSPKDQFAALLDKIDIREVVSSSADHMITDAKAMLGSSATNASETFPLKEVLGQNGLSEDEWSRLIEQGVQNIDYSAYGHDLVGSLALTLTKTGDAANYDSHRTTKTGESVEQYFLTAHYVPAEKKAVDYRTTPGGSPGALTDNMRSENTHVINVYEVPLDVYKTDGSNNPLEGAAFKLYKVDDENGTAVTGLNSAHKYVEVAAGTSENDGVAQLKADGQPIGLVLGETYYLIESAAPANYTKVNTVWAVQVQTEIGKFTDLSGDPIYSGITPDPEAEPPVTAGTGVSGNMYPFNWDQGARIMLDGDQPVPVIAKGETEGSTVTITDGSFVSHGNAISFRHTVQNIGGGMELNVHKEWKNETDPPDSVTVKLYRVSEKDHHWVEGNVVPCTCTAEGVEEYTCSECGKTETRVIDPAGHTPGEAHRENEVAATCTDPGGYDEVVRCTVCNAIISTEHIVTPAVGHQWGEAQEAAPSEDGYCYDTVVTCTVCGAEQEGSRVHHAHDWGDETTNPYEVTTPATTTAPGVETQHCLHDYTHTRTRTIPQLPNNTAITYKTYRDWYTDGWLEDTVTTGQIYPIGSSVTLSWWSRAAYNATVYINGTAQWDQQNGYKLSGNSVMATRSGGPNNYTYSVTVTVTEGMTLFLKSSAWDNYPTNITITQNKAAQNSAQSLKAMAAPLSLSLSANALPGAAAATLSGAGGAPAASGKPADELQTYLDNIKTKEQVSCTEIYKEEVDGTYTVTANNNWTLNIPDLPKYNEYGKEYTYYVVEIPPSAGYQTTYSGEDSGLKDGDTVTITNERVEVSIVIQKLTAGTSAPLPDAAFTLTQVDENGHEVEGGVVRPEQRTDSDGKITFEKLVPGRYMLEETEPPAGYIKSEGPYYIQVTANGTDSVEGSVQYASADGHLFTIENVPGAALPSTGGPGTRLFAISGTVLTAGAGALLWKRRESL